MRANTVIMILLAVVFGVVAVVLSNMYLSSQRSAMASVADVPADTIVVAAVPLKFGDTLTAEKLREIPWPSGATPVGAFKTSKDLLDAAGDSRQALQAIGANEPVLASKITGPGQRATLSAVLTEGMRAVSIRVNDVLGVAGFVLPGDRVDILLRRTTRDDTGNEQTYVDVLLQSVKVLAVDQVADESKETPDVVKAVTVEVDTTDAQKLTLAADAGQLSLALRQAASSAGEQTQRVTLADLTGEAAAEAKRKAELEALEAQRKALEERAAQAEQRAAELEAARLEAEVRNAKTEAERKAAEEKRLAAERARADQQFSGIQKELIDLKKQFGASLDGLNRPQTVASEPQLKEVVKEVVKYVQPEPPSVVSVGVIRGTERAVYDVPRAQ